MHVGMRCSTVSNSLLPIAVPACSTRKAANAAAAAGLPTQGPSEALPQQLPVADDHHGCQGLPGQFLPDLLPLGPAGSQSLQSHVAPSCQMQLADAHPCCPEAKLWADDDFMACHASSRVQCLRQQLGGETASVQVTCTLPCCCMLPLASSAATMNAASVLYGQEQSHAGAAMLILRCMATSGISLPIHTWEHVCLGRQLPT